MDDIVTREEVVKWEYQISKNQKLIATNRRLYRVNAARTKITVLFRKAILGCEYSFNNTWPIAYLLILVSVYFVWASGENRDIERIGIGAFLISFVFMCKFEILTIKVNGERNRSLYKTKWLSPFYRPELVNNIRDISALEDV